MCGEAEGGGGGGHFVCVCGELRWRGSFGGLEKNCEALRILVVPRLVVFSRWWGVMSCAAMGN